MVTEGLKKILFFFLFMITMHAISQKSFSHAKSPNANGVDAEKIYIQTTGNTFNNSETIWFKAIVTNAYNNLLTNKSKILYVELINPMDLKIVDSKILKLKNGITNNFFQLHPSYPTGKYLIRAYTEWNKNFEDDFNFEKYINVFSILQPEREVDFFQNITIVKDNKGTRSKISMDLYPYELDSIHSGKILLYINWKNGKDSIEIKPKKDKIFNIDYEIPKNVKTLNFRLKTSNKSYSETVIIDKSYTSISFFPEGGSMVFGQQSNIGVKSIAYNGKGKSVEGYIIDEDDDVISKFKTNSLGMGKFTLTPKKEKKYFGLLTSENGNRIKTELPKPKLNGAVLSLTSTAFDNRIILSTEQSNLDSVFIKLYHRGKDLYLIKGKYNYGKFYYNIINKELPHGIIRLTVYDKSHLPICERHFFNDKPEMNLNIEISKNRIFYNPREGVSISIKTCVESKSIPASVSLMAIDKSYYSKTNYNKSDISAYFLLESDVKGNIERPSYYFKNKENLKDLDYLLLTQGWTNYRYRELYSDRKFKPERYLTISGYVGGIQNMKSKKRTKSEDYDISMMVFGKPVQVYNQSINNTGFFNFKMDDSYGMGRKFVIQPHSSNEKSKNFVVTLNKRKLPRINIDKEKIIVPVDSIAQITLRKRITNNIRLDPFLSPNTIELREVTVSEYELSPERKKMVELHGLPDKVIRDKELKSKAKNFTGNIYPWLFFNYSEEITIKRTGPQLGFQIAMVPGAEWTYVVVDGKPVRISDYGLIQDIPIAAIKSVEIVKTSSKANRYFSEVFNSPSTSLPKFPAVLAIYTNAGTGLYGAFPSKTNLLRYSTPQFSPEREFYSPDYSILSSNQEKIIDLRTLLYWEPNVNTSIDGEATLEFYNSDITGDILIYCEGISNNGFVGFSQIEYEVRE